MLPDSKNPQALNRYAYGLNNPLHLIAPGTTTTTQVMEITAQSPPSRWCCCLVHQSAATPFSIRARHRRLQHHYLPIPPRPRRMSSSRGSKWQGSGQRVAGAAHWQLPASSPGMRREQLTTTAITSVAGSMRQACRPGAGIEGLVRANGIAGGGCRLDSRCSCWSTSNWPGSPPQFGAAVGVIGAGQAAVDIVNRVRDAHGNLGAVDGKAVAGDVLRLGIAATLIAGVVVTRTRRRCSGGRGRSGAYYRRCHRGGMTVWSKIP